MARHWRLAGFVIFSLICLMQAAGSLAETRFITVASTTSTMDSGLYDYLLPKFTVKTGIEVRIVAKGTGQAIALAKAGDADVLLVHAKAAEEKFVAEGYGVTRHDLMYNDFLVVGPKSDPAHIAGEKSAAAAFKKIAAAGQPFASRGDESGTHQAERRLWQQAGIDVVAAQPAWYKSLGSGMGATLNTASAMGAYSFADRATWLAFQNKGDLVTLVAGDPALFNQYGVILVNPQKFPHVKQRDGQIFIDWLLSPEGQQAIADFHIDGKEVFFPNAQ